MLIFFSPAAADAAADLMAFYLQLAQKAESAVELARIVIFSLPVQQLLAACGFFKFLTTLSFILSGSSDLAQNIK